MGMAVEIEKGLSHYIHDEKDRAGAMFMIFESISKYCNTINNKLERILKWEEKK